MGIKKTEWSHFFKTCPCTTYKHGDSKSDVLLCFGTKFKSQVYNKLFESGIEI